MYSFLTRRAGRLGIAALLLTAAAGPAIAVAAPAYAAPAIRRCSLSGGTIYNSSSVAITDYEYCGSAVFKLDVSISQFTGKNTWVVVASGQGEVVYICKGTTRTVYETTGPFLGTQEFYDNCG